MRSLKHTFINANIKYLCDPVEATFSTKYFVSVFNEISFVIQLGSRMKCLNILACRHEM